MQLLLDVLREAKGVCVPMVFILDEFQLSNFEGSFKDYSVDRRELSFKSLNVVEMLLLLSMAHLEKCNSIPYNFESIYEEYVRLLRLEDEGGSIGVSTYTFTAVQKARVNQYDLHYQAVCLILDLKHLEELFRLDSANLPDIGKNMDKKVDLKEKDPRSFFYEKYMSCDAYKLRCSLFGIIIIKFLVLPLVYSSNLM